MDVRPRDYRQAPQSARLSAVGVLLIPTHDATSVLFVKRTTAAGPQQHRGQIGFPGGKKEVTDTTLRDTAVREVAEETGLQLQSHHYLGALSSLYIPVSNFLVQPFVFYLDSLPKFNIQTDEIEHVILASFDYLLAPERIKHQDIPVENGLVLKNVPYYDLYQDVLWGATAMITTELLQLITHPEGNDLLVNSN